MTYDVGLGLGQLSTPTAQDRRHASIMTSLDYDITLSSRQSLKNVVGSRVAYFCRHNQTFFLAGWPQLAGHGVTSLWCHSLTMSVV